MFFNRVDALVAAIPERLVYFIHRAVSRDPFVENPSGVNLGSQHVLVMGSIKYLDHSSLRQCDIVAPEVVVFQLVLSRRLKTMNPASLGVDARHHVADYSIFSRGITCL